MRKKGYSYKKISRETGWSSSTIVKYTLQVLENPVSLYLASAFHDSSLVINSKKRHKKNERAASIRKAEERVK